jgi:hypothetical protein
MNDKPMAVFVTTVIAAPLMLLCCGGAVVGISAVASFISWLGGLDGLSAILIGLVVAVLVLGLREWHRSNPAEEATAGMADK